MILNNKFVEFKVREGVLASMFWDVKLCLISIKENHGFTSTLPARTSSVLSYQLATTGNQLTVIKLLK